MGRIGERRLRDWGCLTRRTTTTTTGLIDFHPVCPGCPALVVARLLGFLVLRKTTCIARGWWFITLEGSRPQVSSFCSQIFEDLLRWRYFSPVLGNLEGSVGDSQWTTSGVLRPL